jgi:rubrerythrin
MTKHPVSLLFQLSVVALSLLLPGVASAAVSEQTLKNVNAAFQGESNAHVRYTAFAKKADEEGFAQVAKLFRATAAAEAIHRDQHKAAILKLGGTVAEFKLDEVKVGSTKENLEAAIKGETYERDTMYPEFIATAKADDARPAMKTLDWAMSAEKEHATLYQNALDNLGKNAAADYYVCKNCGATLTALPNRRCPTCREPKSAFLKIA